MSKLILDSKSRLSNSSLTEPSWLLPSNVPSGKLTVEQFNWNDVGYDLIGADDYKLRIYADQYGNLLYDDKGGVIASGKTVEFNPQDHDLVGIIGKGVGVSGIAGGVIDFAGHNGGSGTVSTTIGGDGSYINTNYYPPNDVLAGHFTWTMLVKIPTLNSSGAANNIVEPGTETTLIGTYQHNTFAGSGGAQGATHEYVAIWLLDNGKVRYAKRGMASDGVTIRSTTFDSADQIDDNQWHRVALVGDGVNNRCYLDGFLLHTFVNDVATFVENPTKPVIVNGSLFRYWEGQAADIRIFQRALSTTEIATLGNTPHTSVVYSNFASPLLIHHNPSIRADFLATAKKNQFMYFQLFISQTHAKAMNLVEARLLDTNNNNIIRDRSIFNPGDGTNRLAVFTDSAGQNPSASHVATGDLLNESIDNSILTNVVIGDPSDGHDELIQFKLPRSFSFDELRRLEVYFFDNNGPHEIRFLNSEYQLIHTHHLYASTPNYGDTNESLVVLKMLGDLPMSGLTDSVADDVETYVLSWADESSISSTFIYRKEDTVGIDRVIPGQPFRNMTLAMMLPGGYEKGSYDSIYRNQLMSSKDSGNAGLSPQPGNITNSDDANPRGTILGFGYNYYVDLVNGHRVYSTYTATDGLGGYDVGNAFNGTADQLTRWIPNINLGYPATFVYDFTQNVSLTGVHVTNGDAGTQLVGDVDIYYYNGAWVKVTNQSPAALTQGISVRGIITFDYAESQYFKVELYQRNTGSGDHIRVRNIEFFGHPASHTQGSYTPSHPLDGVEKQSDGQVGFKFEKADGSAITDSELPSSYSLMCHIGG